MRAAARKRLTAGVGSIYLVAGRVASPRIFYIQWSICEGDTAWRTRSSLTRTALHRETSSPTAIRPLAPHDVSVPSVTTTLGVQNR